MSQKNQYSKEYVDDCIRHYQRLAQELGELREANRIYKCQVARLNKKLESLGVDPSEWTKFTY